MRLKGIYPAPCLYIEAAKELRSYSSVNTAVLNSVTFNAVDRIGTSNVARYHDSVSVGDCFDVFIGSHDAVLLVEVAQRLTSCQ